jgi:hypothetical protein
LPLYRWKLTGLPVQDKELSGKGKMQMTGILLFMIFQVLLAVILPVFSSLLYNSQSTSMFSRGDSMAGFEINQGEKVLTDTNRFTLQGSSVKFPAYCRCIITDQRFVYFDYGKMAVLHLFLGLVRYTVKGKPVSFPLKEIRLSRGHYARNTRTLSIATADGREILLDDFDKTLHWFKTVFERNGMGLLQTGEEEWSINTS